MNTLTSERISFIIFIAVVLFMIWLGISVVNHEIHEATMAGMI